MPFNPNWLTTEDVNNLIKNNTPYLITANGGILKTPYDVAFIAFSVEEASSFIDYLKKESIYPPDVKFAYTEISNVSDVYSLRGFFDDLETNTHIYFIGHGKIHRTEILIRRPEAVNFIRDIIKDTVDCDKMYFVFHKNDESLKSNGYQELFFNKDVAEYFAEIIGGRVQEMEMAKSLLLDRDIKDFAEFTIEGNFVSGWEINEAICTHFMDRNLKKEQVRAYLQNPLGVWALQKNNTTTIFTYMENLVLFSDLKKLKSFEKFTMPDGKAYDADLFNVDYESLIEKMRWNYVFFDGEQHCKAELFLEVLKEEKEKLKFKDFINQPESAFEFRYSAKDPSKNVNIDKVNEIFKESGFELIDGNWVWNP